MDTEHLTLWEKIKLSPFLVIAWVAVKVMEIGDKIVGDK